jgi:hypothetical protein
MTLNDIRFFLHSELHELCHTHPVQYDLPLHWPSSEDVETLVDKSSGQFIYASTVVKFISSHRHRPTVRLEIILGLRPMGKDLPFAELDALYRYVISSVEDPRTTVQIIAMALTLQRRSDNVIFLASFLDLAPSDIKLYLIDLGSLVEYSERDGQPFLNILHATLGDFLFDEARSQELYVERRSIHTKITQGILRYMNMNSPAYSNHSICCHNSILKPIRPLLDLFIP